MTGLRTYAEGAFLVESSSRYASSGSLLIVAVSRMIEPTEEKRPAISAQRSIPSSLAAGTRSRQESSALEVEQPHAGV